MKKIKTIYIASSLLINSLVLTSQISIDTTILSINDTASHFYVIKKNINYTTEQFLANSKLLCKLESNNKLEIISSRIDSLGQKHEKFIHSINGIPIEYSKIIFHSDKNGRLSTINGVIENKTENISTVPNISAETAIDNVINFSENKEFLWLDSLYESNIKVESGNQLATSFPVADLIIIKNNTLLYNSPQNYILAYKIAIHYANRNSLVFYVNASNGTIIKTDNPMRSCNAKSHNKIDDNIKKEGTPLSNNSSSACADDCQGGTAHLYYYPDQYIYTERFLFGLVNCTYRLKEVCSGTYIYVTKESNDFRDVTNLWTNLNDKKGTTTFWCLSWANRFWSTYFGRNSFDNNFHQIEADVDASWDTQFNTSNNKITVGTSGGASLTGAPIGNWLSTIDVLGHELAHGVTDNETQLINYGEGGAIGEGISDIFGTLTEFWTARYKDLGRLPNYEYAEDVFSACGKRRSLSNPEDYCGASTYMAGPNWKDPNDLSPNNDFGGVHYNAGVLGKWFYLLAEGGNGTNDLGNQYCVEGIGQDDASWILYEAIRNYMTSTTNFNDLRVFTEVTAFQYYGSSSPNYHAVSNAWYAVGLENHPSFGGLPLNIFNKTETVNNNYHYNTRINVAKYIVNPSVVVNMSSNDYIHLSSTSPDDVIIKSGAEFHAYIAPGCTDGSRMSNLLTYSTEETSTQNKKIKNNENNTEINVFPNPNTGEFKLTLNNEIELPYSIIIRDVLGKELISIQNPNKYEFNFDLREYNSGIYFINVFYNGRILSKKIITN
jgi:bacillolysin